MSWRLGVVGSPIAHSLTPVLHEAALDALGLTGSSTIFDVGVGDDAGVERVLNSVDAVSVTMPLKTKLMALCDDLDEVASRVGAINSLWRHGGRLHGRSTDGVGFLDALEADFDSSVADATVVVLGSGGAARSIVDACSSGGASRIIIRARNAATASALVDRYDRVIANPPAVGDVALVVNAVAGGAPLDLPACDVHYARGAVAIDIAYRPPESAWLADQAGSGRRTANGLSMLAHQARHQLTWWFDRPVPLEPLLAAVGL